MKTSIFWPTLCLAIASVTPTMFAQQPAKLGPNQTEGFGASKLLTFTYTQSFDCVDQPKDDLDFNKKKAQSNPAEFQVPICQAGIDPTINPPGQTGKASKTTAPIFVLVPMFSVDNDQNPNDAISCQGVVEGTLCGPALGKALIGFFGAVPEAFKASPRVFAQCPDPGKKPGTCTMHASRIDLAPVLAALGLTGPPTANVFVPDPNHSHVLTDGDINLPAIWWQVIPVLVLSQSDWPPQDGSSGITSFAALQAAENAGRAIQAPSNFFLFFSSHTTAGMHMN